MKINNKFISIFLVVAMLFSLCAVNVAADGSASSDPSGSTVTLQVNLESLYSADGTFEITTEDGVEVDVVSFRDRGSMGATTTVEGTSGRYFGFSTDGTPKNVNLELTLVISGPLGETATVTFNHNTKNQNDNSDPVPSTADTVLTVVDYSALNAAIATANEIINAADSYKYRVDTMNNLRAKLNSASALVNGSYVQTEVDDATTALTDAIAALVELDFAELLAQMARLEDLDEERAYGAAAWAAMETAVAAAENLLTNGANDQGEVNAVTATLKDALDALELARLNYDALNEAISAAEALTANDYTAESWVAVYVALEDARDARDSLDQEHINACTAALNTAIENLEEVAGGAGSDDRYQEGYEDGFEDGYESGFADGYESSVAEGGSTTPTDPEETTTAGGSTTPTEPEETTTPGGTTDPEDPTNPDNPEDPEDPTNPDDPSDPSLGEEDTEDESDDETTKVPETTTADPKDPDTTAPVGGDDEDEDKTPILWIVLFAVCLTTTLGLAAFIVVTKVLKKKKESDDTPVVDYNIEDDAADTSADESTDADESNDADESTENN